MRKDMNRDSKNMSIAMPTRCKTMMNPKKMLKCNQKDKKRERRRGRRRERRRGKLDMKQDRITFLIVSSPQPANNLTQQHSMRDTATILAAINQQENQPSHSLANENQANSSTTPNNRIRFPSRTWPMRMPTLSATALVFRNSRSPAATEK